MKGGPVSVISVHVERRYWPIDLMMTIRHYILSLVVVSLVTGVLFAAVDPPVTIAEYEAGLARQDAFRQEHRGASSLDPRHGRTYPPVVLAKHNLQRAMDTRLTDEERTASLELAIYLDAPSNETMAILAMIMADTDTPPRLQQAILAHLMENEYGDLTEFVVAALSQPELSEDMHQTLLVWVRNNADEALLADIVVAWASQPVGGNNELLYRQLTELAGRGGTWSDVLWANMVRREFTAKGSAFEVLRTRLSTEQFIQQLARQQPTHLSIATLQTFAGGFDYIPADRDEMLQAVYQYSTQQSAINAAARVYRAWRAGDAYTFQIHDLHLMGQLGSDAGAVRYTRAQMRADLARTMADKRHEPHYSGGEGDISYEARFYRVEPDLSMADLWNIWLLESYLSQPQTTRQILLLADEDLANTATPFGGLMFLENGVVDARQYPADVGANRANDMTYVPSGRMLQDSRNALCRFICHFEAIENAQRVGPTPAELADAATGGYYGVTITRLNAQSFTAHYYNPDGEIVSLGVFSAGQ